MKLMGAVARGCLEDLAGLMLVDFPVCGAKTKKYVAEEPLRITITCIFSHDLKIDRAELEQSGKDERATRLTQQYDT